MALFRGFPAHDENLILIGELLFEAEFDIQDVMRILKHLFFLLDVLTSLVANSSLSVRQQALHNIPLPVHESLRVERLLHLRL